MFLFISIGIKCRTQCMLGKHSTRYILNPYFYFLKKSFLYPSILFFSWEDMPFSSPVRI